MVTCTLDVGLQVYAALVWQRGPEATLATDRPYSIVGVGAETVILTPSLDAVLSHRVIKS